MPAKKAPRMKSHWSADDPAEVARSMLRREVKAGKIKRSAVCELCGSPPVGHGGAINGHHWRGYNYPLDVWWLCDRCNSCRALTHDGTQTKEQALELIRARGSIVCGPIRCPAFTPHLAAILTEQAQQWRSLPLFVGFAGNFRAARTLLAAGMTDVHACDTTLHAGVLGNHLSGQASTFRVRDARLDWLAPYLVPGVSSAAALSLLTTMLAHFEKSEPFHRRMWDAYRTKFPALHKGTCEKLDRSLSGTRLRSFTSIDPLEFFANCPTDSVAILLPPPPPVKGSKQLARLLSWEAPHSEPFTAERFATACQQIQRKRHWLTLADRPLDGLDEYLLATTQRHPRAETVFVYADSGQKKAVTGKRQTRPVPYPRVQSLPTGPLRLVRLDVPQMNTLLAQYLAVGIAPSIPRYRFGLLSGDELVGAFGIDPAKADHCDVYLLSDFAVTAPPEWRLSKLVLAAVLSTEIKVTLEQSFAQRIRRIGTTAFTDRPESMKYRGLFKLHSRYPGRLNYVGEAGQWNLEGAFAWWKQRANQTSTV